MARPKPQPLTQDEREWLEQNQKLLGAVTMKIYRQYRLGESSCTREDVFSLVSFEAVRAMGTYCADRGVPLRVYVWSRCQFLVPHHLRSQGVIPPSPGHPNRWRARQFFLDEDGGTLEDLRWSVSPDPAVEIKDEAERYLSRLGDSRERRVIELKYGLNGNVDHTSEEIAEKIGATRRTVSNVLQRAYRIMRTEGSSDGQEKQSDQRA